MEQTSKELTEFDSIICDSRIQILKAAIPFIQPREQKFLSIYVKYMELSKTIALAKSLNSDSVGICSLKGNKPAEKGDFLQIIRKYCTNTERETIDMIINFINTYKMFQACKESAESEDSSMFNILKSGLSPEQQEMFEMYSSLLNT